MTIYYENNDFSTENHLNLNSVIYKIKKYLYQHNCIFWVNSENIDCIDLSIMSKNGICINKFRCIDIKNFKKENDIYRFLRELNLIKPKEIKEDINE